MNSILEKYYILYRNTDSIGDQLLISAVLKQIKEKYKKEILLFVSHTELFENNPYIYRSINYKNISKDDIFFLFGGTEYENDSETGIVILMNKIRKSKSKYIHEFGFQWMSKKNAHIKKSLIEFYSQNLNIDTTNCAPELYLLETEKQSFKNKYEIPRKYYIVHSEGIKNTNFKNYKFENIQKIVSSTKHKINWIQVGLETDKILFDTVLNLSGKLTLRELCVAIYYCDKLLAIQGLHTIIATAFNKKNYCIKNDYEYLELVPYDCIKYITRPNFHREPCSLCKGWYCGCTCPYKFGWQNDIDPNKIIDILIDEINM